MLSDLQPPPDAMPLLDAVERYIRDLPDFRHIPNFHQRLKALIAFQRGWGVHTSSWEDFDVWPEDDPRLWTQVANAFLRLWARGELRVEGYGADGVLRALPPERGDSISANDIDWGRGIIFPGTAREVYGVKVAPVPTTDGATAAQTPAVSAAPKIEQYRYSEAEYGLFLWYSPQDTALMRVVDRGKSVKRWVEACGQLPDGFRNRSDGNSGNTLAIRLLRIVSMEPSEMLRMASRRDAGNRNASGGEGNVRP